MAMLLSLGALNEDKAVKKSILNYSEKLKNERLDDDLFLLEQRGYVKGVEDRVYLTQTGIIRAMSNFS